jgi:hypothetical protein
MRATALLMTTASSRNRTIDTISTDAASCSAGSALAGLGPSDNRQPAAAPRIVGTGNPGADVHSPTRLAALLAVDGLTGSVAQAITALAAATPNEEELL